MAVPYRFTPDISQQRDAGSRLNVDFYNVCPPGLIAEFVGSSVPAGWLVCDGSAVSRTEYAGLFSAIGTTFGSGDGSATFNLPGRTSTWKVQYIIRT